MKKKIFKTLDEQVQILKSRGLVVNDEIKAKEIPTAEELADDMGCDSLDEYKEDLKKQLAEQKEAEAKRTKTDEAIQKIVDNSKMEIPEAMIQTQCESMVDEFAQRIAQSGLTMEQYLQFSGMTMDKLFEQVRPEAETRIKTTLVLEAIVKAENIEVSEEDVDAEITRQAELYGMKAEDLKGFIREGEKEAMKSELAMNKAVDFIMANVKERAKAKSKKEEA